MRSQEKALGRSHYPVCILGAGPSGCSASLHLTQNGVHHLLIDKSTFPRDKICGDALSGKVVYALNRVAPGLSAKLASISTEFLPSWGISFYAPNGKALQVPFKQNPSPEQMAPGFIATRMDFDAFLVKSAASAYADLVLGTDAHIRIHEDRIEITMPDGKVVTADMLIDASGAHSRIAREYGIEVDKNHHCAGLRQYWQGVEALHPNGFIELHFIKDVLPGYFWIFPMTNNRVNVGIGMLSSKVSDKKVNLKNELARIIETHPEISKRFKSAEPLESPKGWGLPLGSKRRQISFNRLILTGDAASLIDPFTGEGIGNGMISGYYAAEMAVDATQQERYDADFLSKYDEHVYHHLGPELAMSHKLQQMVNYPWLFNFVVNKGQKSKEFRTTLTAMFENVDLRTRFRDPRFYLKLLFNK